MPIRLFTHFVLVAALMAGCAQVPITLQGSVFSATLVDGVEIGQYAFDPQVSVFTARVGMNAPRYAGCVIKGKVIPEYATQRVRLYSDTLTCGNGRVYSFEGVAIGQDGDVGISALSVSPASSSPPLAGQTAEPVLRIEADTSFKLMM